MELLVTVGATLLAFVGGLLFMAGYLWEQPGSHKIAHKRVTLPCPACRDDDDNPTGITPMSDNLQSYAKRITEDGGLPEFPCTTCDGSKKVTYEFKRGERVRINERQMLEGGVLPESERKGGRFFGKRA